MRLRTLLPGLLALASLAAPPAAWAQDAPDGTEPKSPASRTFSVTFRYYFNPVPKSLREMDFWFPVPPEDEAQTIVNQMYQAPYKVQTTMNDVTGNGVLYMHSGPRGGVPLQVKVSYSIQRYEVLNDDLASYKPVKESEPGEEEKKIREAWLVSDTLLNIDRKVRSRAETIIKDLDSPVDKARAIYDWVIENIALTPRPQDFPSAGFGDLEATLENKAGDSTDLASVFVGLCRGAGIPARNVLGIKIPPKINKGALSGHHTWAEFWVAGLGWIPVDPADGFRYSTRSDYYFGSLDQNRMVVSRGRDIELSPKQAASRLNFFFGGYWEGDGEPMPSPNQTVNFEDLRELPEQHKIPLGAGGS